MNFESFMKNKNAMLAKYPGACDLTETNVVRALGHLRPDATHLQLPEKAHRCHLAEYWLDLFHLPQSMKRQALISQGVRHSLTLLFQEWAREGKSLALPTDIYPVYLKLAQEANADFFTFDTFPESDSACWEAADILLVTHPTKPRGTGLTETELAAIEAWLSRAESRRVVIDAVYTFNTRFDANLHRLLATGQAILLHSLSKGWLHPLVMGVALVPEADIERFTPVFRAASPTMDQLRLAQVLLTEEKQFPKDLLMTLKDRETRMRLLLEKKGVPLVGLENTAIRYLFVVPKSWQELLEQHHILALPLTVFGSRKGNYSVVSSLVL